MISHKIFEVKISDMLKNKTTDTLSFENKELPSIETLSTDGISWEITLQSIGKDAIFATIDRLQCQITSTCDRCRAEYPKTISIENYRGKYVISTDQSEDKEEEILFIDNKNGIIDLGELIYHAIKLQEPFINHCAACEKEVSMLPEDDWDTDQANEEYAPNIKA